MLPERAKVSRFMPARYSIIILNHDKAAYTRACLASLLISADANFEVVLVDNGSRDSTPQVLSWFKGVASERGINCEIIRYEENVGAVVGRNEAMKICNGKFFVFMDNDVMVKDRLWLSKLEAALNADERRGIVSGKMLFPWEPYAIEFAGGAVSPQGRVGYLGRGKDRHAPEHNIERECQCLISACIMLKRELIEDVGMLDEAYSPVQYEDIDLCYRARQKGWKVWYTPHVEMWHFENVTTAGSADLKFRYLTIRNGLIFKNRWRHMFERENGPSDEELRWRELPKRSVEEVFGEALWDDEALLRKLIELSQV